MVQHYSILRRDSNIFCHYRIRKGDVESAFAEADVILEGEYTTPSQEHAYLQPEAGVSYIDEEGRVTVQVAGQWTHEDQQQIAHALNLPVRPSACDLSCDWWCFWWERGYVDTDCIGISSMEITSSMGLTDL